jgi:thioesterase domain-containing protein
MASSLSTIQSWISQMPGGNGIQVIATDQLVVEDAVNWVRPAINPETLVFLQYTSGSTSAPKGVMGSEADASIQAMASHYLAQVRSVQAQGPYLLGGWSMGGVVAFEMARQLQLAGEQAEVFLIDSLAPGFSPEQNLKERTLDERTLLDYFVQDLEGISGKKLGLSGKEFQELEVTDAASSILEQLRRQGITTGDIEQQDLLALFHTFRDNLKALLGYNPMPIAGSLTLIRSSSTGREQNDISLGWSDLALGRFEMHEIEGDHYSIVTGADVNLLAALLEQKFGLQVREYYSTS